MLCISNLNSNRKGKLIFFYEWNIKLKWKSIGSSIPSLCANIACSPGAAPQPEPDPEDSDDEEEEACSGEIEIPNLSEENDVEEVDVCPDRGVGVWWHACQEVRFCHPQVIVTVKKRDKQAEALKAMMHREAGTIIRRQITEYLRCLKEGQFWGVEFTLVSCFSCLPAVEYSKDLILPKRDSSPALPHSTTTNSSKTSLTTTSNSASRPSGKQHSYRL